jgi:hypothetical protein
MLNIIYFIRFLTIDSLKTLYRFETNLKCKKSQQVTLFTEILGNFPVTPYYQIIIKYLSVPTIYCCRSNSASIRSNCSGVKMVRTRFPFACLLHDWQLGLDFFSLLSTPRIKVHCYDLLSIFVMYYNKTEQHINFIRFVPKVHYHINILI